MDTPVNPSFSNGHPYDPATGKGGIISGPTNDYLDKTNPSNLGKEAGDTGIVPNLKWTFSSSHVRILEGAWLRTQTITDLPRAKDISGVQVYLKKGYGRELHWHTLNKWGIVLVGNIMLTIVDEKTNWQVANLTVGDIFAIPKGSAHSINGIAEDSEVLIIYDDGNSEAPYIHYQLDDWIPHIPKDILAKSFGVDPKIFNKVPVPDPYVVETQNSDWTVPGAKPMVEGNASYVFYGSKVTAPRVPGGGGSILVVDSVTNFPVSKTVAAAIVTIDPGAVQELHWNPNVSTFSGIDSIGIHLTEQQADEWAFFWKGTGRATVFVGGAAARTFDFAAGDTAVFPISSGHYIENTSPTEPLIVVELFKSDHAVGMSLTQVLALTPPNLIAKTLNIPLSIVKKFKKTRQLIVPGNNTL
ncbi:MAG: hypothetical protein M1814_005486 [Vezdaea aestivalis]|nr:MAG: hypothetical protein M1814_005486 [Vezdaea aestivalis]